MRIPWKMFITIMTLSFRTDRSGQTVQTARSSLFAIPFAPFCQNTLYVLKSGQNISSACMKEGSVLKWLFIECAVKTEQTGDELIRLHKDAHTDQHLGI